MCYFQYYCMIFIIRVSIRTHFSLNESYSYRLLFGGMGNIGQSSHPLPQIWQRVNTSYLRNKATQQVIEQHTIECTSQQQQNQILLRLRKRIGLHHPGIAKVIYFRLGEENGICNQIRGHSTVLVYTEYVGDSLESVLEERGERLYHHCQCVTFMHAAYFLAEHYGNFIVTSDMIFMGNRREKASRLWISPHLQDCVPFSPSSEVEMCESIIRILKQMRHSKICSQLTQQQFDQSQLIKSLNELKNFVFMTHKGRQQSNRHKKSNSGILVNHHKEEEFKPLPQRLQTNKKAYQQKANSLPQRNEEYRVGQRSIQSSQRLKHPLQQLNNNSVKLNINYSIKNHESCSKNVQKHNLNEIFSNNPQVLNPPRINFIYGNLHQTVHQVPRQEKIVEQLKSNNHLNDISISEYVQQRQRANSIKERGEERRQSSNYQIIPHFLSCPQSPNSSPQVLKSSEDVRFTARQMQLPLREAEQKVTPARLPTTSRSPKGIKEEPKPSESLPEVIYNRYQRKISSRGRENCQKPYISGNMNKFQKYKDAIKSYQQKLRQRLANSIGGNPARPRPPLGIRKTTSTPNGGQFKQTKSVYNDSDQQNDRHQILRKKAREREQKKQLQKQLQKEKALIENQMQDLLKQNAMKEQYRSIREKIKHKKQTFAQLKAEATKILQDLDY